MEAVCLTCQVRYEFGEELLQQHTPVLCPTCQVPLMLVHPGTNTRLDQPLDSVAVQQTQPQEYSPPLTDTETPPHNMTAATSPSTGQPTPSDPGQATSAPAFEAPGWEDIVSSTSSPPKTAPATPPIDDWSAAAARWAANGFSANAMPEFVKQPAQPSFSPVRPAAQLRHFLPTPMPASSPVAQSESSTPIPPPLPVQTVAGPVLRDSIPPWASAGNEAEPTTEQSGKANMEMLITPLAANVEADAVLETQAEEIADEPVRSSHIALWLVLVLLLVGAGGAAVWYFFPQEDTVDIDSADKQNGDLANSDVSRKTSSQNKGRHIAQAKTTENGNRPDKLTKPNTENSNASEAGFEEYKKGNIFIKEGKFKEAVNEFKKALFINPKLAQAHRGLGISFAQLRQNQQACQEYRLYRNTLAADSKEISALEGILKDCR